MRVERRDKRRLAWLVTAMLTCMALSSGASALQPGGGKPLPPDLRRLGMFRVAGGMSIDQAVAMVEKRFQARVVRAEAREEDGRTIYVLRLLNESGRVWIVRVDAQSGAVLN